MAAPEKREGGLEEGRGARSGVARRAGAPKKGLAHVPRAGCSVTRWASSTHAQSGGPPQS
jgi:hypothetical protein